MSEETYQDGANNSRLVNISAIYDEDGSTKFINDSLSSSNFDGYIFTVTASIGVTEVYAGQLIGIQQSSSSTVNFYPIVKVEAEDPILTSPYTGAHYIYYLDNNETFTSSYSSSAASVIIKYDDWDNKDLGTNGWTITSNGNAIFSNIAARGRIEATSGFIGDAYSGWEIGANLLSNASVGLYAPSAFSSAEIAIFSGSPFTGRTTAPFRVNYGGLMNATGASISGALTATTLNVGGSAGIIYDGSIVTIGSSVVINSTLTTNSLQVGASPTLLRIANDVEGTNDGIYIDPYNFWYSDGKFSVGGSANSACWNGNVLSVKGNIIATSGSFSGALTASVGTIGGFTLAGNQLSASQVILSSSGGLRLGPANEFSVDQAGNLVASTASITGRINATSGSFSGDITASAGRFVGALSVSSSGAIYAGTNVDSGQRTVLNASGLFGYHSSGIEAFALPVSGSPRLGTFTIIPTGIVSQSASNANMIYGNVDSSGSVTDGIVIRGSRISGASAAIYTVQNGVETSYAAGNGFYVDENARFKLKGATGSLAFDGNDLYVSGNINATSGQFTGSVVAQHITASTGTVGGWTLSSSGLVGGSGANTVGIISVPNSSSIAIFAGNATASAAPFQVTNLGKMTATNAEISGQITSASITSTFGIIAGWTLSSSALTGGSGTNTVGLVSTPQADNISIYAGSTTPSTAPFRVTKTGSVFATNATITGDITATNITASVGKMGGFVLSASSLTASPASGSVVGFTTGASAIFVGATSLTGAGAPFLVGANGSLFATNATITGKITATSGAFTGSVSAQNITASIGTVGGFLLSSTSLTASISPTTAVGLTTGASAIFAGATSRTGVGAKFWVSNAGNLYAVSASILGDSIINGTNIGNGAGNISSNLRVGTSALGANTSGTDNLALGDYALYSNTTGINNLAVGASSLFANNGLYNTAIGYRTLATNNSGGNNVAVGKDSLEKNTTGFFNVALGSAAIANKGVGDHNIALGSSTLYNLLDGSENLAFGQQALSIAKYVNENVAIGSYALGSLGATGSYKSNSNIAIGHYAGIDILNGSANVFIGYRGLGSDVSRNIFIANGSNQLGLRIDESQKVYLYGDLAINTNAFYVDSALSEVGIGTAAPASALHIVGGLYVTGDANIVGNVSAAQLLGSTPSGTRALAATRATTTAADEIAIFRSSIGGADTTKFSFQANGRLRAEGDGSFGGDLAITGATTLNSTTDITGLLTTNRNVTAGTVNGIVINSTNNYTTNWNAIKFTRNTVDLGFIRVASAVGAPTLVSASDYRLKKNIEDDSRNFTEVINGLRPVTFEWKNIENSGKTYGFIAHEVQEYVPEAVGGTKDNVDENGNIIPQDLTHQPFVYYLIGAFKESVQEIQTLKAKMIELESKINELGGNNG